MAQHKMLLACADTHLTSWVWEISCSNSASTKHTQPGAPPSPGLPFISALVTAENIPSNPVHLSWKTRYFIFFHNSPSPLDPYQFKLDLSCPCERWIEGCLLGVHDPFLVQLRPVMTSWHLYVCKSKWDTSKTQNSYAQLWRYQWTFNSQVLVACGCRNVRELQLKKPDEIKSEKIGSKITSVYFIWGI